MPPITPARSRKPQPESSEPLRMPRYRNTIPGEQTPIEVDRMDRIRPSAASAEGIRVRRAPRTPGRFGALRSRPTQTAYQLRLMIEMFNRRGVGDVVLYKRTEARAALAAVLTRDLPSIDLDNGDKGYGGARAFAPPEWRTEDAQAYLVETPKGVFAVSLPRKKMPR